MRKRKQVGDPIADCIARTNRRSYKGLGAPDPDLGIQPSDHPLYLRRDAYVFLLIGFTCLPITAIVTWATAHQPRLDAAILAPITLGSITVLALYMGITNWLRWRKH